MFNKVFLMIPNVINPNCAMFECLKDDINAGNSPSLKWIFWIL